MTTIWCQLSDIIKLKSIPALVFTSEASNLLFKTIIFHVTPYGPQVFTQGFSDGGGGGVGGALKSDKWTPPRWVGIS